MFLKNCLKVFLILGLCSAEAREIHGVDVPERLNLESEGTLVLQGAGLRRQFFLQIYVAALYVPKVGMSVSDLVEGPETKVLTLKFMRDVDWDDVTEALEEGIDANTPPKAQKRLEQAIGEMKLLIKRVGSIHEGGVLRLDLTADSARFLLNDKDLGLIYTPGLGKALLRIWIGAHPAQESLKRDLLGSP